MKFAFFGAFGTFDYSRIGGTESFARRLAQGLIAQGHRADFITYGAPASDHREAEGIGLYYNKTLEEAFRLLANEYKHIVTMYLRPTDRLRYLLFRRRQPALRFHQVYFSWPDSRLKRQAAFMEARLYPFNGRLFCVSLRQYQSVRRWSPRAVYLLPPVPESYFLKPDSKPHQPHLRVTYVGRTEPGKGIETVIDLFQRLKGYPQVQTVIHGYYHPRSASSRKVHEWLSSQNDLRYHFTPYENYSPTVEDNLRAVLKDTDVLLLPYQRLSSTIDTPVLLLEGMAALCAVFIRAAGNIADVYGPGPFLLRGNEDTAMLAHRLAGPRDFLEAERQRLFHRNAELGFSSIQITKSFLKAIV